MFQTVVSFLTFAAMLLHAVLGCCAHHAHAGDGACASGEAETVERHTACGHGHAHHAAETDVAETDTGEVPAEEPCRHEECDEESCSYLASSKASVPAADAPAPHGDALAPAVAANFRAARCAEHRLGLSRSGLPPSLRVRDVTQVRLL